MTEILTYGDLTPTTGAASDSAADLLAIWDTSVGNYRSLTPAELREVTLAGLASLTGANTATGDYFAINDISAGTWKKILRSEMGPAIFADYTATSLRALLATWNIDVTTVLHVDGASVAGTEDGSTAAPFKTMTTLQAALDTIIGPVEIHIRAGTYRPPAGKAACIDVDSGRIKRLRIVGETGKTVQLLGSYQVTSGWTQHPTQTNLWYRSNRYQGTSPSAGSGNSSGVVDISSGITQTTGYASGYTLTGAVYGVTAYNTALATLNGTSKQAMISTADQRLYIHPAGVDPNTKTFECSDVDYCIRYRPASGTSAVWNTARLELANLDLRYAQLNGLYVERADVDLRNVRAQSNINNHGFYLVDCGGRAEHCIGLGNYGDGFNNGGQTVATFPVPPTFLFLNCEGSGAIASSGDGFSNHTGATWTLIGCKAVGNNKNGFSPAYGDHTVIDFWAEKNVTGGIFCAVDTDRDVRARIIGGYFVGNYAGIQVNAAASATKTLYADIVHPHCIANERGIYVYNGVGTASLIQLVLILPEFNGNTSFTQATLGGTTSTVVRNTTSSTRS